MALSAAGVFFVAGCAADCGMSCRKDLGFYHVAWTDYRLYATSTVVLLDTAGIIHLLI